MNLTIALTRGEQKRAQGPTSPQGFPESSSQGDMLHVTYFVNLCKPLVVFLRPGPPVRLKVQVPSPVTTRHHCLSSPKVITCSFSGSPVSWHIRPVIWRFWGQTVSGQFQCLLLGHGLLPGLELVAQNLCLSFLICATQEWWRHLPRMLLGEVTSPQTGGTAPET